MIRELKGWHVAAMFGVGFSIIIAVNLTLAYNAVSTFPGLEVKNSYVASQQFETRRDAQNALGWTIETRYEQGALQVRLTGANGAPVMAQDLSVVVGRATHVAEDVAPEMTFDGSAYRAPVDLAPGQWLVRLSAVAADGTLFEQRIPMRVAG